MINSRDLSFLILLGSFFALQSCRAKLDLSARNPHLQAKEANLLYNKLGDKRPNIDWISGKIDSKVDFKGQKAEFTTNFRFKQDSILWLSISPALGIEVVRLQLTTDSVFFLNKLNKQYYTGTYDYLQEMLKIEELDLCLIQDLLTGAPMLIQENEKWRGEIDSTFYVLKNVPGKKLRKSLGITNNEDFDQSGDSLYLYNTVDRRLSKVLRKKKDNDRYLKRYFLSENFNLVKVILTDVLNNRVLTVNYGNFIDLEGNTLPTHVEIHIGDAKESSHFELEFSKIKSDLVGVNSFKIPDSYAPIRP